MSIKKYMVYCEPCGYKKFTDGSQEEDKDLVRIPKSEVPGGSPKLDPITNITKIKKSTKQSVMVKCPNCGRGIKVRKLNKKNEKE